MIPLNLFFAGIVRSLDTVAVRAAMRVLGAVVLFCILFGTVRGAELPGSEAKNTEPPVSAPDAGSTSAGAAVQTAGLPDEPSSPAGVLVEDATQFEEQIKERDDVGTKLWMQGDRESAERTFADALSLNAPMAAKRELLLRMVQLYQNADDPLRAIAVMEKFLQTFPEDREHPQLLIRLGLLYRETGAFSAATARFYQVLNSTLRLAAENLEASRRVATKARLEIADTYMTQGLLEEAQKFYGLLQLLDLEPADRERVQFRGGQLQHARKLWQPAERELGAFLTSFPESSFAAEARYLRAKALKELGRKDEAVQEVIALLRGQDHATDPALARSVAYWKRRTGNELANTFYEQGDILGALAIYQALARASEEPSWRWPAVYQVGLCFERLHLPERAAEAYKVIVAPDPAPAADVSLSDTLVSLQGMAQWRLDHLDWIEQFENKLQVLTAGKPVDA
jgi:tetratricopeptide (TPR) repeat protein